MSDPTPNDAPREEPNTAPEPEPKQESKPEPKQEPRPREASRETPRDRPPRSSGGRDGDDRDRGGDHRRGRGLGVRVDGNIERAIKTFRKRIERDGLLKELRRRRFYEKPSERRKRKQREAAKRRRKAARRGR